MREVGWLELDKVAKRGESADASMYWKGQVFVWSEHFGLPIWLKLATRIDLIRLKVSRNLRTCASTRREFRQSFVRLSLQAT
uniref:Uncharacterized protein n=1 Tax=Tetranychus urticae TaxID=32264 RepID=T1KVZ5_TETUR